MADRMAPGHPPLGQSSTAVRTETTMPTPYDPTTSPGPREVRGPQRPDWPPRPPATPAAADRAAREANVRERYFAGVARPQSDEHRDAPEPRQGTVADELRP